ncbi:MAG: hypothetical protein IJA14_05125 [Alphaproteobacteria bacterium]|nr:hypothetical protein [Alphaproteobacteria bacterium]
MNTNLDSSLSFDFDAEVSSSGKEQLPLEPFAFGKKARLVDGSGFIYRAFYAMPQMVNKKGEPVGAVYGFCSMMLPLLNQQNDLFCVVLDAGRNTFRNEIYPEYKSNRAETPADLKSQFSKLLKACEAFGLPVIEMNGYEADDIIATYAAKLSKVGYSVEIVSSDKDLMQLVSDNVCLFDPVKSKTIGRDEVFQKYGVYPEQMITLQTLMGDSTDNIPGIKGVGPKTAAKLVNQFATISEMYENIDSVTPLRIREMLAAQRDTLKISEQLVTLRRDVPIDEKFSELTVKWDENRLLEFFSDNEFYSLVRRIKNGAVCR